MGGVQGQTQYPPNQQQFQDQQQQGQFGGQTTPFPGGPSSQVCRENGFFQTWLIGLKTEKFHACKISTVDTVFWLHASVFLIIYFFQSNA